MTLWGKNATSRTKTTPEAADKSVRSTLIETEKANLVSQTGLYLWRQLPTLPHTFACSTIGPAGLNLRRFAGVSEAGARSRNPEPSLRRISHASAYSDTTATINEERLR